MTSTHDAAHPGWDRVSEPHEEGVVFSAAGEGAFEPLGAPGDEMRILVDGSQTRDMLALIEQQIVPGAKGPGVHWHRGYDELFYVVSGSLGTLAGREKRICEPRDFIFVPRGVIHSFFNPSDTEPCRFISAWSPPGNEQIFAQAHALHQRGASQEELFELLGTLDIDVVFVENQELP
jgi:mannose-6-phosphate isomerase-like protein (cupin superfamily)